MERTQTKIAFAVYSLAYALGFDQGHQVNVSFDSLDSFSFYHIVLPLSRRSIYAKTDRLVLVVSQTEYPANGSAIL